MDLTPPLSRSPASPPNSYCPSESSSLGYPSPDLVAQPYKLSSIYGAGLPCSMTPPMDPDTSLPPMEAMGPAGWSQATVLQPSSSSGAVPSILSSEYDPFGSYEHGLAGAYAAHDVYASHASQEASLAGTPPPGSHPRSPVPPPTSRTPLSYVSGPSVVNPMTPRVKLETPAPDYNQNLDVGHYPSPRSVQAPYSVDPSAYPATTTVGYLADAAVPAWAQPLEPGQYFTGSGSPTPGQAQDRSFRVARHRRARRLTTKEEANFQCEVKGCGKLFSRSYNFKAHMETHDEKREYPFPCQAGDCNKKFVRKTDLQRHHQSVHMKERNHRCDYCGRMFARKDTLRRYAAADPLPRVVPPLCLKLRDADVTRQTHGRRMLQAVRHRHAGPADRELRQSSSRAAAGRQPNSAPGGAARVAPTPRHAIHRRRRRRRRRSVGAGAAPAQKSRRPGGRPWARVGSVAVPPPSGTGLGFSLSRSAGAGGQTIGLDTAFLWLKVLWLKEGRAQGRSIWMGRDLCPLAPIVLYHTKGVGSCQRQAVQGPGFLGSCDRRQDAIHENGGGPQGDIS